MSTHTGMKNGTMKDLLDTINNIKVDLIGNSSNLMNRYEHYTKKYRGNRLEDVNVGLISENNNMFIAQIFVRNRKGKYIREKLRFNNRGRFIGRVELKTNMENYD